MGIKVKSYLIVFTISSLLLIGNNLFAQDSYYLIDELVGEKIVLYDASGLYSKFGPYLYLEQKGKLKVVKDVTQYSLIFDNGQVFNVMSQELVKNKKYLLLSKDEKKYYLIIDAKKDYLSNIRSYSYWENKLKVYCDEYQFRQIPGADISSHPCGQYKFISWSGVKMPDSYASDVQFAFSESDVSADGKQEGNSVDRVLTYDAIRLNATKYINQDKYNGLVAEYMERMERERMERMERERLDSIADMRPIIAKVLHTYDAKNAYKQVNISYDEEDENEIRLYSVNTYERYGRTKYTYSGFSLGNEIIFNESDLSFINQDDANYLKRRGINGVEVRKEVAKESDLVYTTARIDSLKAETDKILKKLGMIYSFYEKKKIFITGQEYAFGEYEQFGLRFEFYNCYAKQIKYVEIKMVPYNPVDDIQTDDLGRSIKEVRCIGPIEPKERATYEFDELWWDKRDLIERVDVTRIKLIFKDNTSVSFSSKAQVDAHRSSNYSLSEMGITD